MACACRTLPSNGMMFFIGKSCISADRLVGKDTIYLVKDGFLQTTEQGGLTMRFVSADGPERVIVINDAETH